MTAARYRLIKQAQGMGEPKKQTGENGGADKDPGLQGQNGHR